MKWDITVMSDFELKGILLNLIDKAKRQELIRVFEVLQTGIEIPYVLTEAQQVEVALWQNCKAKNTPSVYLEKYPQGHFYEQAFNLKLEDDARRKRELEEKERQKQVLITQLQIEMVLVKGGIFEMEVIDDYGNKQTVTLSDFNIGKYPVTQKQWRSIMGTNPSYFKGDDLPVENVSWNDCQVFINLINEKTGKYTVYRQRLNGSLPQ